MNALMCAAELGEREEIDIIEDILLDGVLPWHSNVPSAGPLGMEEIKETDLFNAKGGFRDRIV